MNEVLALLLRRHRPDNESLSALLDGRLEGAALERMRSHLASCEACRARLDGLRQARDTLRALPNIEAPRSFRLRASDVQAPAPVRRAPTAVRALPVLAAAAALVFAVVLEADLARGGSSTVTSGGADMQALSAGTRTAASADGGIGDIGPASSDNVSPVAPGAAAAGPNATQPTPGNFGRAAAPAPVTPSGPAPSTESNALAPSLATPPGGQSAPLSNPAAGAPSVPPTPPPPEAKAAVTQPAAKAVAPAHAPVSGSASSSRSDATYHVVEALAAAIALAAAAGTIVWRVRNRKVEP